MIISTHLWNFLIDKDNNSLLLLKRNYDKEKIKMQKNPPVPFSWMPKLSIGNI